MTRDLVSIIVPVYNAEKNLDRCVGSMVNQTHRNLQIILVDDGSKDHSPRMCDAWAEKDRRIRVIHKENAGAGLARNEALKCVGGDYICFLDSDDYLAANAVEKALGTAKKTGADVVVFGMQCVDALGQMLDSVIPGGDKLFFSGEEVQNQFLPDLIDGKHDAVKTRNLCLSFWSGLFSADLIRRAQWQIVSEREYFSEDSYSLIRLYRHVQAVSVLPEALYYYQVSMDSLSHVYRDDQYTRIRKFYMDCHAMADSLDYDSEVHHSVSGLFLSFTIAAMKQIVAADAAVSRKWKDLNHIIADEILQQGLQDISGRKYGRARSVLFWALRNRCCSLCYVLLAAQNHIKKTG